MFHYVGDNTSRVTEYYKWTQVLLAKIDSSIEAQVTIHSPKYYCIFQLAVQSFLCMCDNIEMGKRKTIQGQISQDSGLLCCDGIEMGKRTLFHSGLLSARDHQLIDISGT